MKKITLILIGAMLITTGLSAADKMPLPDEFVKVDLMPEMIKSTPPVYPEKEKKAGTEGDVFIKALIDKEGKVVKAEIAETSGYISLDSAAVEAAFKNEYKPAMQESKPVAVWVTYKVTFSLDDDKDKDKDQDKDQIKKIEKKKP